MKIGIFDSGVGGLSVLKKIRERIDFADILYYGDNLNAPYGDRSIEEVQELCLNIAEFLTDNMVDLIIVACNTATVVALDLLREKYASLPIIGVVEPGALGAKKKSKNKKIGVLATTLTANSGAYEKFIKSLDSDIEVYTQGAKELCIKIENGWKNDRENNNRILKGYIDNFPDTIDTIVLGCTHYPLIIDEIQKMTDKKIVDPADETLNVVLEEIEKIRLIKGIRRKAKRRIEYFVSGDVEKFKKVAEQFLCESLKEVYQSL